MQPLIDAVESLLQIHGQNCCRSTEMEVLRLALAKTTGRIVGGTRVARCQGIDHVHQNSGVIDMQCVLDAIETDGIAYCPEHLND
jgi:hypothetical protein